MTARVGIVVAAYDPGRFLRPTLESVLAQTEADWTCVVVDDGSAEDLSWVGGLDPRVRLVRQANAGVARARNAGARDLDAPLLCFLDQDDLWRPGYLATQLPQFDDPDVVLASTGFDIVGADGEWLSAGFAGHNRSYADLLTGCGVQCATVMVRRTAFERAGGFRAYPVSQDWDLWLRILRAGGRAARTEQVLGSWRRHSANASDDYRGLWRDGRRLLAGHDHPASAIGRRRVRELSGVQAFDAARAARTARAARAARGPRSARAAGVETATLARHLLWAAVHAPGYTARALLRRPARDA